MNAVLDSEALLVYGLFDLLLAHLGMHAPILDLIQYTSTTDSGAGARLQQLPLPTYVHMPK